ncbi:MAG: CBS domain-containing protein [Steroidobacteraceae bacterium]
MVQMAETKVARVMAQNRIGSAIVTKHGKLVGIFTVTDACRALAEIIGDHDDEANSVGLMGDPECCCMK